MPVFLPQNCVMPPKMGNIPISGLTCSATQAKRPKAIFTLPNALSNKEREHPKLSLT